MNPCLLLYVVMTAVLLLALQLPLLEVRRPGFHVGAPAFPPKEGVNPRSLPSRGTTYIRLLRACLSQFLLK